MNLKLALATIGVSILGATSAFAQNSFPGLSIVFDPQQNNVPGILDYNANFTYTIPAGGLPTIFVVPNGLASLTPGAGYTDTSTGIALGLYPMQLGNLGGGNVTGTINEVVFSLNFGNTAQNATGLYDFFVYNGDPFGNGQIVATVPAAFVANVRNAAVPEPGTVALLVGMGVAGLALRRRRK